VIFISSRNGSIRADTLAFPHGHYEVFIDEAGNLGFNAKSSRTFVVSYLVTDNPHVIRTPMRRLRKGLNQKRRGSFPEFKFSRDSPDIRDKVLRELSKCPFDLGLIVIDKSAVKQSLKNDPQRLYRFLVINYVVTSLVNAYDLTGLKFIIDRSLSGEAREAFNMYLREKLSWRQVVEKGDTMPTLEVVHALSESDECLQAADYCAGATFAKFEHEDPTYYDAIRNKIAFKTPWGPVEW
jgi:Protein of unknown function (DUF3800)